MSVLFGMPPGIGHDLEDALAALQTFAGKQAGTGRWINPTEDASLLRVDGNGNTWTIGTAVATRTAYTIVGNTMWLNIAIASSALTIAAATNTVYVRIPDGYLIAGAMSAAVITEGRSHYAACYILNNGTAGVGLLTGQPGSAFISAQLMSAANFVTSTDFAIQGQIALDVVSA